MKAKIVKFKNGKFGIRRRSFPFFYFQYLGQDIFEDYWWTDLDLVQKFASFVSVEAAEARMNMPRIGKDKGVPI